ncbi:MAG: hypothetical protein PVH17_04275 [Anaerolineae bacterium]|jgi:hypothetical protein
MDYGKILSRAWEITWRWKVLWILGFLASLGQGGSGGGGGNISGDSEDWSRWGLEGSPEEFLAPIVGIIIAIACLAILIGIALWVISIMARGGLIAGVQQVEDEGSTSFLQAWRVGRSRFWTLFGLDVLTGLPILLLVLLGVAVLIAMILGGEAAFDEAGAIVPGILCGGTLCCGLVILSIVLGQIKTYGDRAAILEGLGWIDAFKRGWEVLKNNLGPTVIFLVIFLVIGLVLGAIIFAVIAGLALPFVAVFASVDIEPGPWLLAPVCCGGLLFAIVAALISSIVTTFTSATWTLTYRELTGTPVLAAVEPAAEL